MTYVMRIKTLRRLRLSFSQLPEHKFRHGFQDTLNLLCSCGFKYYHVVSFVPVVFLFHSFVIEKSFYY